MHDDIKAAHDDARRYRLHAHFWRGNFVWLLAFWFLSDEPVVQRVMFVYLAALSILAIVVTYDGKAEAAEARAAATTDTA